MRARAGPTLTDEEILAELRRIAHTSGRDVITQRDVHDSPLIGLTLVKSRFGSWPAAVDAAGLRLAQAARRWTTDEMFENLQRLVDTYGRLPTSAEVRRPPSTIGYEAYATRFGTSAAAKRAFATTPRR